MGGSEAQVYKKLRSESGMRQHSPAKSLKTAWKSALSFMKGASWRNKKCDTTRLLKNDTVDTEVAQNDIILRTYRPRRGHKRDETKAEIDKKFVVNVYRNSRRDFAKDTREQTPDNNTVNRDKEEITRANDKLSISARSSGKKVDRVTRQSTMEVFEKLENCSGVDALRKLRELDVKLNSRNSCDNPSKESGYNTEEDVRDTKPVDDDLKKLKEKAEVQSKLMKQAANAIDLCRGDPTKFRARVEAERILLISTCKHERLQQDISNSYYETPNSPGCVGTLVISNLRASLEVTTEPSWFLCTVSNSDTFHATKAVSAPPGATLVEFKEEFVFEGLHPDFRIRVQLYAMVHEKPQGFKVQTLCRRSRKVTCGSAFQPHSSADVDLGGCSKSSMKFKAQVTQVKITQSKTGFVTVTTNKPCSWSRRWCTLKDTKLSYWSYPAQEDTVPPEGVVHLEELLGEAVVAERSYCARSRTLMLRCPKRLVFLKFDTSVELHEWMDGLNEVYHALKSWNLLRM